MTTLTALRDTTYHNEKTLGFLDVSQNVVFAVSPPAFASVLSKRLDYAKTKVFADQATAKKLLRTMEGFSIDSVKGFIEVMSEIVGGSNVEIRDCIQALAATDVRRCLELLRMFCTSPNTDIERLMKEYNKGYFKQPLAILIRSLMCGTLTRYVERTSPIYNLFQVPETHVDSHFVSLRVLQYLDAMHRDARNDTDVPVKQLVATVSSAGFTPGSVNSAIERMGERRLLLSRSHPEPPWDDTAILRLGGAGKYYLDALVYEYEYIKNVVDDTVVYDANISATLLELQKDREIAWPRKNETKMQVFVEHLLRNERRELSTIPDARVRLPWCAPVMPIVGERLFGSKFVREHGGIRRRPR